MAMSCYRIEYEKAPNMAAFTAFVVANTFEEAIAFVNRVNGGQVHITSQGFNCRVDAITDEVCIGVLRNFKPPEHIQRAIGLKVVKYTDVIQTEPTPPYIETQKAVEETEESKAKASLKRK